MGKIAKILGGGQQKAPTVPTVDPEAERRKAEAEAAAKAMQAAQDAQEQAAMAAMTANVVTVTPTVEAPAKVSGISSRSTCWRIFRGRHCCFRFIPKCKTSHGIAWRRQRH